MVVLEEVDGTVEAIEGGIGFGKKENECGIGGSPFLGHMFRRACGFPDRGDEPSIILQPVPNILFCRNSQLLQRKKQ